jgi:hypothetical protein
MFISHQIYEMVGTRHAIGASLSPSKPFRPQFVKEQFESILIHGTFNVNNDGFVNRPISALRIIPRRCGVRPVRLPLRDLQALISNGLRNRPEIKLFTSSSGNVPGVQQDQIYRKKMPRKPSYNKGSGALDIAMLGLWLSLIQKVAVRPRSRRAIISTGGAPQKVPLG